MKQFIITMFLLVSLGVSAQQINVESSDKQTEFRTAFLQSETNDEKVEVLEEWLIWEIDPEYVARIEALIIKFSEQ